MPAVVRQPPAYAVQQIYVAPSDYVFTDRFGAPSSIPAFLQQVDNQILAVRQWYWDMLQAGRTFDVRPTLWYISRYTTAEWFAKYPTCQELYQAHIAELNSLGLLDAYSGRTIITCKSPVNFPAGMVSGPATAWGSPWFQWGGFYESGVFGLSLGNHARPFMSEIVTVASPASSSATAITVASGGGRRLAVAARFMNNQTRVSIGPGNQTGTTMTIGDTNWLAQVQVDGSGNVTVPFDAVVWPYGQEPTVSNAETVRFSAVHGTSVTFTRGLYGTTPIFIVGGVNIAARQKYARVWTSPQQPESSSSEVVRIDSIVGDTLTVARGQTDAVSGTAARALLTGDNLAVGDDGGVFFAINQRQATGGWAHELGHNLGMHFYTPAEAAHQPYVVYNAATDTYSVAFRDRSGEARPSPDVVTGVDFWEHLYHTPDNPLTPGTFGPYVMWSWYDWPWTGALPPAEGFTANEKAQVLLSRALRSQARPAAAPIVTAANVVNATGAPAGGGGSSGGGSSGGNVVNPIAYWASDTATNTTTFPAVQGYTVPYSSAAFLAQMDSNIQRIRRYFYDRCGGYTFDANPSVLVTAARTNDQIEADPNYGSVNILTDILADCASKNGAIVPSSLTQIPILIAPIDLHVLGFDGIPRAAFCVGYNPSYPTASLALAPTNPPFFLAAWGQALGVDNNARSGTYFGAYRPQFGPAGAEANAAVFQIAHELGHAMGYNPTTKSCLEHVDSPVNNLMNPFATLGDDGLEGTVIDAGQVARLKASAFMSFHSTRP